MSFLWPLSEQAQETQDRTRKRVKEELKESTATHAEFAESQLPKLKRAYIRKCQEVEVCTIAILITCCGLSYVRYCGSGTQGSFLGITLSYIADRPRQSASSTFQI